MQGIEMNGACCESPKLGWVGLDRSRDKVTAHNHWSNGRRYRVQGVKLGPKINAYVCKNCGRADRPTHEELTKAKKAATA